MDLVLAVAGFALLVLGLPSTVVKRVWLSVSLVAVAVGVVLGPALLGVLEPDRLPEEHRTLEELARITLSISVVAVGLQFRREDLRVNRARGAALLTGTMVGMWLATSLGAWLLLGVDVWLALLIGAILTPTDPVVASALVTGRLAQANLPRWLRRSLQLEAGANDGLAVVFVLVPALALTLPGDATGSIASEVARQILVAVVAGTIIGFLAAKVVDFAEEHQAASEGFFLISTLAVALAALGATHMLGGSGVLASFFAGLTFSLAVGERYAEELETMQDALLQLLVVPIFVFFGAVLPWDEWIALGWSGLAFALWAVFLRRPIAAVLALLPTDTPRRGKAFLAWYGPIGVSAIYYTLFVERYALPEFELIFAACTLAIAASVVVFSITATPGVRRYAGRSPLTTLRHPLTPEIDDAP